MKSFINKIETIVLFAFVFAAVGVVAVFKSATVLFGLILITATAYAAIKTLAVIGGICGLVVVVVKERLEKSGQKPMTS